MTTRPVLLVTVSVAFLASAAMADWDPGDPHKMHFPQLPDPNGWDVSWYSGGGEPTPLADDWTCSQTGPVTDIHIWLSVEGDDENPLQLSDIEHLSLAIYDNNPSGAYGYSEPNDAKWFWMLGDPGQVTLREYGTGDQGWYDPIDDDYQEADHQKIYQLNITGMTDYAGNTFVQQAGEVYWLRITELHGPIDPMQGTVEYRIGWKTADTSLYPAPDTGDHYLDDAVYKGEYWNGTNFEYIWQELRDPITDECLDLAFVITPEPATLGLLVIGGLALLRRRHPH